MQDEEISQALAVAATFARDLEQLASSDGLLGWKPGAPLPREVLVGTRRLRLNGTSFELAEEGDGARFFGLGLAIDKVCGFLRQLEDGLISNDGFDVAELLIAWSRRILGLASEMPEWSTIAPATRAPRVATEENAGPPHAALVMDIGANGIEHEEAASLAARREHTDALKENTKATKGAVRALQGQAASKARDVCIREGCDNPIPGGRVRPSRTCSPACRKAVSRRREREDARPVRPIASISGPKS
jgi:hypothetical protein